MTGPVLPLFEQRWPKGEFRYFQLGFVVPDLMSAAARWVQVFGVGPFHIMPRVQSSCRYRGADTNIDVRIGVAQAGPVQIELIQDYTEGGSVFADMATQHARHPFGFHQVSTLTRDYDAKVAHYLDQNYELACEFTNPGQRVAFIDTVAEFGFFTEIVEEKPSFQVNLAKITRTCQGWDGTDPIRILTREGYRLPGEPN
ncbi:VOC family protein [[Mycobacterium] nativiensis]|uniref:VOC family protein n=1 Tax=[Mycobacterium] nativiensis TaxID=2855503 RepID=A0ABU5Y3X5_9MYCO|nr:VOC family protein [Mycolicibacter sp. MYC340]MEB3034386.1 VOC family protein [Mycolicibacter sp. MYC340]